MKALIFNVHPAKKDVQPGFEREPFFIGSLLYSRARRKDQRRIGQSSLFRNYECMVGGGGRGSGAGRGRSQTQAAQKPPPALPRSSDG